MSSLASNKFFYLGILGLLLFWLTILEFSLSVYENNQKSQHYAQTARLANQVRQLLETEINTSAFLATGIESYIVARKGLVDEAEMSVILPLIYKRGTHFRNIGIAPGNQISVVFPLEGNEAVIGLKYEENPKQWPVVQEIIESGKGVLAGPLPLIQGGNGLIFRAPIFIGTEYWGLLSTVMDADSILSVLEQEEYSQLVVALRGKDAKGARGEVFYGDPSLFTSGAETLRITVPGGGWQMAYQQMNKRYTEQGYVHLLVLVIAIALSLISAVILRGWFNRNLLKKLQKQVEERTRELNETNVLFESVLSSARSFAIIAMDKEGTIRLFNTGAEMLLGYQSTELEGQENFSIVLQEARNADYLLSLLDEGTPYIVQEIAYKTKNKQSLNVQVVLSAIRNDQDVIVGYLAIAEDISERKRIERMKNEFISTVSHELRTPLTAISGALGLLKGGAVGNLPEALTKLLDLAYKNSQRLNMLINDILDMEKLLAGKVRFDIQAVGVKTLLESALETNQIYAGQFNVRLMLTEVPEDLKVLTDETRFAQIMANLISNAAKFSPEGGQVLISALEQQHAVVISVTDYGPGIPESFHAHIFQKFAQADSSDTRQKGGSGLGLAITRELVERMNGEVGFETTDESTTFFFSLPKDPVDAGS